MDLLQPAQRSIQVDLLMEAEVRLPAAVVAEAERAADLLGRMAAGRPRVRRAAELPHGVRRALLPSARQGEAGWSRARPVPAMKPSRVSGRY
ncbi:hypothetical protein [Streptomyces sp. NBC_00378]|uniref:hypothetical protein n=1 Tax=unclassified Streptomyces TaxID=2593676 RepID=UPI00338E2E89